MRVAALLLLVIAVVLPVRAQDQGGGSVIRPVSVAEGLAAGKRHVLVERRCIYMRRLVWPCSRTGTRRWANWPAPSLQVLANADPDG